MRGFRQIDSAFSPDRLVVRLWTKLMRVTSAHVGINKQRVVLVGMILESVQDRRWKGFGYLNGSGFFKISQST